MTCTKSRARAVPSIRKTLQIEPALPQSLTCSVIKKACRAHRWYREKLDAVRYFRASCTEKRQSPAPAQTIFTNTNQPTTINFPMPYKEGPAPPDSLTADWHSSCIVSVDRPYRFPMMGYLIRFLRAMASARSQQAYLLMRVGAFFCTQIFCTQLYELTKNTAKEYQYVRHIKDNTEFRHNSPLHR